ncbi:hypothetical protein CapIbe_020451 [Capra ibex]
MAPHSSTLAWKTPWREDPGHTQVLFKRVHYRRFPKGSIKAEPDSPIPWVRSSWTSPPPVWAPWPPGLPERQLSPETAWSLLDQSGCRAASVPLLPLLSMLVGGLASP